MAGFTTLYTFGIMFSDPVTAAVVLAGGPIVGALMAKFIKNAPIEKGIGVAILMSVTGAILVSTAGIHNASSERTFRGGELLLFIALVCWTWYSIKAQDWLAPMSQLRITTVTSLASAATLVVIFTIMHVLGFAALPLGMPGAADISMLLWIGPGSAGIAIILWNYGVSKAGVPVSSLFLNLVPVFAVLAATLFGSTLTLQHVLGGLFVLVGVAQMHIRKLLAAKPLRKKRRQGDEGRSIV
jgi:drug/metabolite transporter (DMT)-like permease